MNRKTVVVALGGNALQKQGEASAHAQQRVADATARHLVPLILNGYRLVIVHGNGPQVGNIVLHEESINTAEVPTFPLDTCVAMSQGAIGFWLQQALIDEFSRRHMRSVASTVVTQVVVDKDDPAFKDPTKPIGVFYKTKDDASAAANGRDFVFKEDAGRGWRRVVPSPKPLRIVEEYTVKAMLDAGVTVITGGGGGVPVIETADEGLEGVEAVVDKDLTAAVVADAVDAEALVILTAVDNAMVDYGKSTARAIGRTTVQEMQRYVDAGQFAPGSMLPKVQAAMKFAQKPGRRAIIASLEYASDALDGQVGTVIES